MERSRARISRLPLVRYHLLADDLATLRLRPNSLALGAMHRQTLEMRGIPKGSLCLPDLRELPLDRLGKLPVLQQSDRRHHAGLFPLHVLGEFAAR